MTRTRTRLRRIATPVAGLAAASLLLVACGDDDDEAALDPVEPVEETATLLNPQLNGLEVTVTGNVSEVTDGEAFQIDKDGLGTEASVLDDDLPIDFGDDYFADSYDLYDYYDYDYDYYDLGYYTDFDQDFDDFDEQAVLVVTPGGSVVDNGDAVQVNGTLRHFDEAALESLYGVDLADDLYGPYEDQYVIVADSVKTLPADRESAMAEGGETDGSTTTTPDATETEGESGDGTATEEVTETTEPDSSATDDPASETETETETPGETTDATNG